jgi:hypothetical protein
MVAVIHGRYYREEVSHVLYYKLKNKLFYFIFFTDLGRNYKNYKETPEKGGGEIWTIWTNLAPKNKSPHVKKR